MKNLFLITLSATLLSFTLYEGSLSPSNYKIYSSKTSKEVTLNDIILDMENYDVVFFGEEHNDSVAHFLQTKLLEGLYNSYGYNTTLSMEMFESDCQMVLNEYLHGFIREKNFIKEARTWSNYRNYKPMIEFAKENKLNVIAANAPARYANMAARKGKDSLNELSLTAKTFLPPLPYDTASGLYYEKFTSLMSGGRNAGTSSKGASNNMMPKYIVHSQSLWDATMAYSISKVFVKNNTAKVLHLNGRFHSDERMGIVTQLKKYNPQLRVLVISCIDGGKKFPGNINYNENIKLGDYVIYSDPSVPKTYKE